MIRASSFNFGALKLNGLTSGVRCGVPVRVLNGYSLARSSTGQNPKISYCAINKRVGSKMTFVRNLLN